MDATKQRTMYEIELSVVRERLLHHGGNRTAVAKELERSRVWVQDRAKALKLPFGKRGRPRTA